MSKIEFFALGGQDERQKECHILTIDQDIYVFNMGISVPPSITLGIKKKVPDFAWLLANKQNIKGIFIGTPSYEKFGSLEFFYKFVPNLPIYTSNIGQVILKTYFEQRAMRHQNTVLRLNIRVLEPTKPQMIGRATVIPFKVSNSLPNSLGFIFKTNDGNIIYLDDFIVNNNHNVSFEDQTLQLSKLIVGDVLFLAVGAGNVGRFSGFTTPNHRNYDYYDKLISNAPGRVIVACYDDDAYSAFTLAMLASKKQRPFIIYSNTFVELFKTVRVLKMFKDTNLIDLDSNKINQSENGIIVITGTSQRLFAKLNKIIAEEDPKFSLKETDTFIFSAQTLSGYETFEAKVFDNIVRNDVKAFHLPKTYLAMRASDEDHKYLANLIKPAYIIPISGLYKEFIDYTKIISQAGVSKDNIIVLDNGEVATFVNRSKTSEKKYIKLTEQYIGTQGVLDVGASSLFERDQMGENGVILVNLMVSRAQGKILKFNFDVLGVTLLDEANLQAIKIINDLLVESINLLLAEFFKHSNSEMKELKISIKKLVIKQYEKKFNKKPLVLPTIIIKK